MSDGSVALGFLAVQQPVEVRTPVLSGSGRCLEERRLTDKPDPLFVLLTSKGRGDEEATGKGRMYGRNEIPCQAVFRDVALGSFRETRL